MTTLLLMLLALIIVSPATPLSGQYPSDRDPVSAALRVVADSLTPWNAVNGVSRTVTRFYLDARPLIAAQQSVAPTSELSGSDLVRALQAISSPGERWEVKGSARLVECKAGSMRECRMDPSIAVVTVGRIERLSENRVGLHIGTKQLGADDWLLYFVTHRVVLEWRNDTWLLVEYSQPEVS